MDIAKAVRRLFEGKSKVEKTECGEAGSGIGRIPGITIVAVADLHLCFPEDMEKILRVLETDAYDCVVFLGDIRAGDIKKLVRQAGGKPCLYVIGNHDEWGQNDGIRGLTCLDGKTVCVNGVRISGVSGAPRYKDGPYGMRTEEEVRDVLSGVGGTDILISHESPYHLLGTGVAHSGFSAISDFIAKERVPMHIFGHHHIDYSEVRGSTREICVYGCSVITTRHARVKKIL